MGKFNKYPYINLTDLNLDWVIEQVKNITSDYETLSKWREDHEAEYEELKREVAGLIQNMTRPVEPWDGTKAYTRYTLVSYGGDTYIALQDVPAGVLITNTDYWEEAQTIETELNAIKADIIDLEKTRCKTYLTMDDMIDDFTSDDVVCCVINGQIQLDSVTFMPCGLTYFVYYETAPWVLETPLTNGGYAVMIPKDFTPCRNDGEAILPALLYTGYSYCGVNKTGGFTTPDGNVPNVTYQSNMGPFGTTEANAQGMQCSQFVNAVLRGVPYERSRLADASYENLEDPQGAGDALKVNNEDYYFSANQLAHFCAAKGWFKATNIMDECEIGDIVFMGNTDPDAGYTDLDWRAIIHCAVVVGKARHTIMIMQCGSTSSIAGDVSFGRIRRRPGSDTDGVNFDCIANTGYPFQNSDGYYGMKGYARIPLHFGYIEPAEDVTLAGSGPTAYAAAASNATSYLIRYSAEKHAKFGIMRFSAYSALKDNSSGILLGAYVENTAYSADGTSAGASTIAQAGTMLLPYILNCDGDTNNIQLTQVWRTSGSTAGSSRYNDSSASGKSYLHLYS